MEGKCVILAAPSGSGKTSIVHRLLEKDLGLEFSVSATSRPKRGKEEEGSDYYFLDPQEFRDQVDQGKLIEWEEVYPDRFYGTLHSEVERIWKEGKHVIFDVDVVGALNLKKTFGEQALAIFIQPPSLEVLEKRIRSRGTEGEKEIGERLEKAEKEMRYAKDFDLVIVNDDLERAAEECGDEVRKFLEG
jgi:guanylate kinase